MTKQNLRKCKLYIFKLEKSSYFKPDIDCLNLLHKDMNMDKINFINRIPVLQCTSKAIEFTV